VPSVVLEEAQPFHAETFAVVGTFADDGRFVRHASLVSMPCEIKRGDKVPVHQMRPPLDLNPVLEEARHFRFPLTPAHLVGYAEGLTREEVKKMETWLARVSRRTPIINFPHKGWNDIYLDHYVLYPPALPAEVDKKTGNPRYWRFSCVGLVLECYRLGAGINLLDLQSQQFPTIGLSELVGLYPDILAPRNLAKVGLSGSGPWPIALPGYLFHAFQRSPNEIRGVPYLPTSNAETRFP